MSEPFSGSAERQGIVRLFPLPNLVLFPGVIQPLHIFEQRYRQMTADALEGDATIALVLLQPGWESDYEGRPAIHPIACLGKIIAHQRLEDGRYTLMLRGICRIRLLEELPLGEKLYRQARVEILEDEELLESDTEDAFRKHMIDLVPHWFPGQESVLEQFRGLLSSDVPAAMLCDMITFALPLDMDFKQTLLEQTAAAQRMHMLTERLRESAPEPVPGGRRFPPPEFSVN